MSLPVDCQELGEFPQVVSSIMRTGRSLRMVLHSAHRQLTVAYPFYGVVIEVKVCDLKFFRT
jgi:hypothetical protein